MSRYTVYLYILHYLFIHFSQLPHTFTDTCKYFCSLFNRLTPLSLSIYMDKVKYFQIANHTFKSINLMHFTKLQVI